MDMIFRKIAAVAAVLLVGAGIATPVMAQEQKWIAPCDVFENFKAAGRAESTGGQKYGQMCSILGNDPIAEACLELRAIEEGVRPQPGMDEETELNEACDMAIVAGPPPGMEPAGPTIVTGTPDTAPALDGAKQDAAMEMAFWESVKDSEDPSMFAAYLSKYPQGTFAPLAQARMQTLSAGSSSSSGSGTTTVVIEKPVVTTSPNRNQIVANKRTQRRLQAVGCYRGAIDGIWGNGSANAVRRFNSQTGQQLSPGRATLRHVEVISRYRYRVCR